MRSRNLGFLATLRFRVAFAANSMDARQARENFVGRRGNSRARRDSAFLQHDKQNNSGAAHHSGRGVRWLGKLRNLSRKYHTEFSDGDARSPNGERRKRKEHRLRNVSRAGQPTRQEWRRGAHDHQSAQVTGNLFPMSPRSARTIPIAASSPGAGGENELCGLP